MKANFLFFLSFCALSSLYAQTYEVTYTKTLDISDQLEALGDPALAEMVKSKMGPDKTYKLVYSDSKSIFQEKAVTENVMGETSYGVYKDHLKKDKLEACSLFGKRFLVTDALDPADWRITNDVRDIGGHKCRRAELVRESKATLVAWFTSDIAISDGPDEFYGLPGLILEAKDGNKTYLAQNVQLTKESTPIALPEEGKLIDKEEYDKIKAERLEQMTGGLGGSNSGNVKVIKLGGN